MTSWLSGFALGLSLIVAIGAQNAFVLRQGLRREHVFAVCALCAGSDAILIIAGVAGFGALIAAAPGLAPLAVRRRGLPAFLWLAQPRRRVAQPRRSEPRRRCRRQPTRHRADLPRLHAAEPACLSRHAGSARRRLHPVSGGAHVLRRGRRDGVPRLLFRAWLRRAAVAPAVRGSAGVAALDAAIGLTMLGLASNLAWQG